MSRMNRACWRYTLRHFLVPGPRVQISTGGGGTPTWSRTKNRALYAADGEIVAASYTVAGDSFVHRMTAARPANATSFPPRSK